MKSLNYSSITALLRRINAAKAKSDETGIPVRELMDQDRELRIKLQRERREAEERRNFLRTAGGLGLGAGMMAASPMAFAKKGNQGGGNDNDLRIAIVGGGTGGLRTAHRLMQFGIRSTVYEASDRLGGRMYSDRSAESGIFSDDRVIEWGGEFISTEHTAARNLAHQLGLELEDVNKLSLGDEETYLIEGVMYNEHNLLDEWVGGIYDIMKRAQLDAPWQPMYNTEHTAEHLYYDNIDAIDWMEQIGYGRDNWVHKILLADLIAEYGITEGNSALNLIYLLGWNTRNSGGLPLAGTDERLHVIGGNDLIPLRMRDQLVAQYDDDVIKYGHKLEAISGDYNGPYTLSFDNRTEVTCDLLVMALPFNLIADVDIADSIWDNFIPQKRQGITEAPANNVSDNGKVMMEITDRHWDMVRNIQGRDVQMAARAYSFSGETSRTYRGFISTWEGEPGNPSPLGLLVDYNGGYEARNLKSRVYHGAADPRDVNRVLEQAELVWPGISAKYNGRAVVSNWIDDPLARSAFTSPSIGTMTGWWGSQWVTEGNIYFAGEAYDMEYWSYMNGAVLSGERVATEIHQNF